ncbi:septum formation family protein [Catelliglobosispora koreensis]|uniref:septum formation family protein n=1 Tax=Catelliglobosispora koreensis TaxID=129052 RepID=UPI0003634670|nr:septum formation family protein [Catelliglobosispora koreensis]
MTHPSSDEIPVKQPGRKGHLLAMAGIALGVAGLIGVGIAFSAERADRADSGVVIDDGDMSVFSLRLGDCVDFPAENTASLTEIAAVPCAQPHDGEVFAELDLADGAYPGNDAVQAAADKECGDRLAAYVSASYEADESIYITFLYPHEESWKKDRGVTCIAGSDQGKLTGSIKG